MSSQEQLNALIEWYQERGLASPPQSKRSSTDQFPEELSVDNIPSSAAESAPPIQKVMEVEGSELSPILIIGYTSRNFCGDGGLLENERNLLAQMFKAINIDLSVCHLAFFVDSEEEDTIRQQRDELRALVTCNKPKIIFAMGKKLCARLANIDKWDSERGKLSEFFESKVIPTWHPRSLLEHPPLKRDSWNDLKLIASQLT